MYIVFKQDKTFSTPLHTFDAATVEKMELKYYNSEMHRASFVLPTSFQKVLYLYINSIILKITKIITSFFFEKRC